MKTLLLFLMFSFVSFTANAQVERVIIYKVDAKTDKIQKTVDIIKFTDKEHYKTAITKSEKLPLDLKLELEKELTARFEKGEETNFEIRPKGEKFYYAVQTMQLITPFSPFGKGTCWFTNQS